ncbi:MAG: c-type cytochrome domain-containing protein [Limisphaerales bacterium]
MKNIIASLAAATWFVLLPDLFAEEAAKLPPPSDRKDVTFVADIKPIFDQSCVECHGPKKKKGGLRLDTRELALKGASHGPVFKPGDSANSELVKLVARIGDEENWMPPIGKGKPLTKEQVGLLRAWIDQGAK